MTTITKVTNKVHGGPAAGIGTWERRRPQRRRTRASRTCSKARGGISPDLIVGCSSGALYGAAIAMGMNRSTALTLWSSELTEQRRWRAYAELLAPRLFGFGAHFSLRDAGRISARIQHGSGGWQLESLATPMRIVTTDTTTAEGVVGSRGSLADALYASVALPFVFPSIPIGGRRLADGVLSNPLPVSVENDARAVITLGFRGVMPRRIDRPGRLLAQVTTTMINNLQQAHVQAAQAAGQRVLSLSSWISMPASGCGRRPRFRASTKQAACGAAARLQRGSCRATG